MEYSVQRTDTGKYGIWLEEGWLKTHFESANIECEEKEMVDLLCTQLKEQKENLEIIQGKIEEPHFPLYHILSFYSQMERGFDLIGDDYQWIISCDPIFHPVSSSEQSAQLAYFSDALDWIDQIGAEYEILPQRFQSREELEREGQLDDYLIEEDSADIIYEHWLALPKTEKAAFYYIYLNAEHNFIASFLALKGVIDAENFGKMVTASIGVSPEFSGVTEKTFSDGWKHYSKIANDAIIMKGSFSKIK